MVKLSLHLYWAGWNTYLATDGIDAPPVAIQVGSCMWYFETESSSFDNNVIDNVIMIFTLS